MDLGSIWDPWNSKNMNITGGVPQKLKNHKFRNRFDLSLIWELFGINFPTMLTLIFHHFSASVFGCRFRCLFRFLFENGCQRVSKTEYPLSRGTTQNAPKTVPKRICDATSTFHRFCMDFGAHFHWFLVLLVAILDCFLCWFAVFAASQIPTH